MRWRRFDLPTAEVQRGHQLAVQPFAEGVLAHQLGELADDLRVAAAVQLRRVECLGRSQPAIGEPARLVG